MPRILIVEDDERIWSFLRKGLQASGYASSVAETGGEALALLTTGGYDLVLLDIGLPDIDGLSVLRKMRTHDRQTPVIVLTARDAVSDRVDGLEGGADDYVCKPFAFEELLARVRVQLRTERTTEDTILQAGDATLDLRTRRLSVDGRLLELSAREFALAELFFRHPNQVLSREQVLSNVWGYDYDPGSNVVEVYVRYLRQKIGPSRIKTVRGMGYRLEVKAQ
jgi:two-component system copper resistance phosphate regulon response regulator CusR